MFIGCRPQKCNISCDMNVRYECLRSEVDKHNSVSLTKKSLFFSQRSRPPHISILLQVEEWWMISRITVCSSTHFLTSFLPFLRFFQSFFTCPSTLGSNDFISLSRVACLASDASPIRSLLLLLSPLSQTIWGQLQGILYSLTTASFPPPCPS